MKLVTMHVAHTWKYDGRKSYLDPYGRIVHKFTWKVNMRQLKRSAEDIETFIYSYREEVWRK